MFTFLSLNDLVRYHREQETPAPAAARRLARRVLDALGYDPDSEGGEDGSDVQKFLDSVGLGRRYGIDYRVDYDELELFARGAMLGLTLPDVGRVTRSPARKARQIVLDAGDAAGLPEAVAKAVEIYGFGAVAVQLWYDEHAGVHRLALELRSHPSFEQMYPQPGHTGKAPERHWQKKPAPAKAQPKPKPAKAAVGQKALPPRSAPAKGK